MAGSVPGESQFSLLSVFGTEEREILREMSDLGDIDHVKEEEEALPVFFSPGDQHCLSVISAIDKLLQSSSSI